MQSSKKRSIFIIAALISQDSLLHLPSSRHQFPRCSLNLSGNLLPQCFYTFVLLSADIHMVHFFIFESLLKFYLLTKSYSQLPLGSTPSPSLPVLLFSMAFVTQHITEFIYLKTFNVSVLPEHHENRNLYLFCSQIYLQSLEECLVLNKYLSSE